MGMRGVLLELRRLWAGDPAIPRNITIGRNVYIGRGVRFDWNFGHLVTVGDDCTIVGGTRIVCHDASSNRHLGVTWCAPVTLGRRVYIGADSLVMPGVTIGDDAVVAAGAVVTSDVAPGAVVAGVPARQITTTAELDGRRLDLLKARPCFGMTYHGRGLTLEQVRELRAAAAEGGYFLGSVERAKASAAPASSDESFGGSAAPDA